MTVDDLIKLALKSATPEVRQKWAEQREAREREFEREHRATRIDADWLARHYDI